MKYVHSSFSFNPESKTIFLPGRNLFLENVLLVTNVTKNTIIYNFADPNLGGHMPLNTNILYLSANLTGMLSTDRLQIIIDDNGDNENQQENYLYNTQNSTADIAFVTNTIKNNTDNVENLLLQTNTLLNELTSFTFYGVTSSTPMYINQGNLDASVDSVTVSGINLDSVITELSATNNNIVSQHSSLVNLLENQTKTHTSTTTLTSRFVVEGSKRVYSIFGFSDSTIDQYIQLRSSNVASPLVTVFYIPAKSNFSFDFPNGIYFNTRFLLTNSLTPIDYTPGNNDLFVTAIHSIN